MHSNKSRSSNVYHSLTTQPVLPRQQSFVNIVWVKYSATNTESSNVAVIILFMGLTDTGVWPENRWKYMTSNNANNNINNNIIIINIIII